MVGCACEKTVVFPHGASRRKGVADDDDHQARRDIGMRGAFSAYRGHMRLVLTACGRETIDTLGPLPGRSGPDV